MKKALLILFISISVIAGLLVISPGNYYSCSKEASGVVTSVYASAQKDLVLKVAGFKWPFCINGGLKKNFNLQALREKLLGKKVRIEYAERWNPLDPWAQKNIASIQVEDRLLYSNGQ